jgi:uncharacterized membrane protein
MSQFVLWLSIVIVTLVAALMFVMPALVRPTLPLGVSVPQSRIAEPVVRASVRRYRMALIGAWIVGIALTAVLFSPLPVAASIVPILVVLALGVLAYLFSRAAIVRAKNNENWYQGVPVRLTADITADSARAHPPVAWIIAAVVILLAATAVGVAVYPQLPDPVPVHWNAAGHADTFAAKSVWSVFGPLMAGFGVIALLFACSFLVRVSPSRSVVTDDPAQRGRRAALQRRLMSSLLGQLAVVIAAQIGWLAVAGWLDPGAPWLVVTGVIAFLVLLLIVLAVFVVRYHRAVAAWGGSSQTTRADAPDDDRYWRGGVIYVNRDDPAVFVPKRFGVGWTVNLGSAGGIALGVALLLVVAGAIVLAVVAPRG